MVTVAQTQGFVTRSVQLSLLVAAILLSLAPTAQAVQSTSRSPYAGLTASFFKQLDAPNEDHFRLEQDTSTYDDYVPLKVPFTQTDKYLKLDAFLIGLKLDDWYLNSTNCLNSLIYTIDDRDYLSNNRTLRKAAGEGIIEPWLNFTGLLGRHLSNSLPFCYNFYTSIIEVETERYQSFDGWGEILVAFLFNQMGNALAFTQKFENIKQDKETQNWQGVYMEYGDLVHIIWDFQKLESSSQEAFAQMMQVFGFNTTDAEYQIYINAMERFENYVNNHTRSLNETFSKHKTVVRETAAQAKHKTLQATNQFNYPWDAYRVANGFWNGAVDVFPIKSLQDLCRNNVTETRKTSEDLFVNNRYNLPEENLEYITAFSRLMQKPYGLSFSCLFGLREVFSIEGKKSGSATEGMTEEEKFANDLIIINDVFTNIVFNMGYIYQDISGYQQLKANNLNYWSYAGAYAGDLVMRFWYRKSFSSEFQFDTIKSCDTTDPDVTCLE